MVVPCLRPIQLKQSGVDFAALLRLVQSYHSRKNNLGDSQATQNDCQVV